MKYPFKAFVLTPSMLVKEVELVRDGFWSSHHETANGKGYRDSELFKSAASAIRTGRARLDEQREKLAKQQANIDKRAANLDKSEAKLK